MAEIPFTVTIKYQADEEVLSTRFYYLWDGTIDDQGKSQLIAADLAANFYTRRTQFQDVLGNHCLMIAIEVSAPVVEGIGPAYYQVPVVEICNIDGSAMTDQVCAVYTVRGQTELDTPVRNSKLISGLTKEVVNCNVLAEDWIDDSNGIMNTFLPSTINLSNGQVTHVVKADRGAGVYTYHPVTSKAFNGVVGSYGTRRGDVTPKRGKLVVTPPPIDQ
jgi:hypothetical protein